jgi:hypothetical protein
MYFWTRTGRGPRSTAGLAGFSILTYPLSFCEANLVFEFREPVEASLAVPLFDRGELSPKFLELPPELLANLGLTFVFVLLLELEFDLVLL